VICLNPAANNLGGECVLRFHHAAPLALNSGAVKKAKARLG
jgi:hypothetical protein